MSSRPIQATPSMTYIEGKIQVQKLHPKAEFPYKENPSDTCYDITLIGRSENRAEDDTGEVNNFNTGIALTPPQGYYFEMVARSSLHKHGYMLATGTSIIDPGYTGELIVPLYKYKEAEDLEMPFRAVQLILRPVVYAHLESVKTLASTDRGDGAFGSTGFMSPQQMMMMQSQGGARGAFIQNPNQSSYVGDMGAYQTQVSQRPTGMRRPHAAPPRSNHMF